MWRPHGTHSTVCAGRSPCAVVLAPLGAGVVWLGPSLSLVANLLQLHGSFNILTNKSNQFTLGGPTRIAGSRGAKKKSSNQVIKNFSVKKLAANKKTSVSLNLIPSMLLGCWSAGGFKVGVDIGNHYPNLSTVKKHVSGFSNILWLFVVFVFSLCSFCFKNRFSSCVNHERESFCDV